MIPKLFVATKAFIVSEGKVLVLRESGKYEDGTNMAQYDLPGGRLTPGEQVLDALKREVLEETGLTITIKKPFAVGEWRPIVRDEPWQVVAMFFECSSDSQKVLLSKDHDHYQWIDPNLYESVPLIENLKSVFNQYNQLTK